MNNKKYLAFACLSVLLLMSACQGTYVIEKFPPVISKYDSSKPAVLDEIKPNYGVINNTFIVEGNFPGGISEIKVYFGDKRAVVLSTDGHTISGLVPKQDPGYNPISVVVRGGDSLYSNITFKYSQSRLLTNVAGNNTRNRQDDGDINAASFREPTGVGAVKGLEGDNVFVVESWWIKRLRFISLDDSQVFEIERNNSYSGPAVTSNRERVWLVGMFAQGGDGRHEVIYCDRSEAWKPTKIQLVLPPEQFPGYIWATAFDGDDDRYLYAMDVQLNTARIDTQSGTWEMITHEGDVPPSNRLGDRSDLIYSRYHGCFFACVLNAFAVYKLTWKNDDPSTNTLVWEVYAGKPATSGLVWGNRLTDAEIRMPYALCESMEGDIYIVHRGGAGFDMSYVTRITAAGQVELAVGRPGSWGYENGDPLESRLDQPQDMCMDSEGNFYIADGNGRQIRKLTIE